MKWYVLRYNFNKGKIENFNIFDSSRFNECIVKLLKKYTSFEDFKENLDKDLMYCFWSKREYEIMCADLFEKDMENYEKISVYDQVKPNLDVLARYILGEYNGKRV